MTKTARGLILVGGLGLLLASPARAQGPYIYPSHGQSPEQQSRDRYDCHTWAVQQTGVDPTVAQATPPPGGAGRGAVKGAAGGAALGAVGGAIGGDAGKGAAIGAGTGALFGAAKGASQKKKADAAAAQRSDAYNRAFTACLEGRGYTIR